MRLRASAAGFTKEKASGFEEATGRSGTIMPSCHHAIMLRSSSNVQFKIQQKFSKKHKKNYCVKK